MTLFLTIPGSVVSKKNSKQVVMIGGRNCPRRPMILPSKAYQAWEKEARKVAWAKAQIPPLVGPIHVEARFYYKGAEPDLSGCCESIADAMEGILWANDRQIVSWDQSRKYHDKDNPRTEIRVEDFGGRDAGLRMESGRGRELAYWVRQHIHP